MIQILVIEDEKRVADLLKIGLEENGYQVIVAYDGEMGWRLFQSNSFQLVISDIVLPKLNGFELCQSIRQADEQIPILMPPWALPTTSSRASTWVPTTIWSSPSTSGSFWLA